MPNSDQRLIEATSGVNAAISGQIILAGIIARKKCWRSLGWWKERRMG